ncbi:MAG: cysteine desulfurase [Cytophagales bacterium]|nr:cysteine desulfurase [Cytophagales bacterium]MDW8384515.1 cysteine desulfurase family protein [Flammeovirgaceae bacterium]
MKIYLDNAATTPVDESVWESALPYLKGLQGNPSSIHAYGRFARNAIEKARRKIADILGTSPSEIFFTSGGTESDNTAIRGFVLAHQLKRIITTRLEHHAVLHTVEYLKKYHGIEVVYLPINQYGDIDLDELEKLLQQKIPTLVSLMHGNNEIGNVLDLEKVGFLCKYYHAFFHSDTVQTVGYYPFRLSNLPVDSIVGSAHKFHGIKGSGFLYIKAGSHCLPLIFGGAQERNMRGGTENIAGIVAMATALEKAHEDRENILQHALSLKKTALSLIKELFNTQVCLNGRSASLNILEALPHLVSLRLPPSDANEMLLFNLDIEGIAVSGGSACASGSVVGSHVMEALGVPQEAGVIRLSWSKYNKQEDIRIALQQLHAITKRYQHV